YGKQQSKLSQESQQDNNQEHHHSDQKKTPRDTSNDLDMFAKYLQIFNFSKSYLCKFILGAPIPSENQKQKQTASSQKPIQN
ncbi:hypothetical protein C2G38_2056565, partial [Gigaspora rosea]